MTVPGSAPLKSTRSVGPHRESSSMLTACRKIPQGRSLAGDWFTVGHRMTIATDMRSLLEESAWERLSRALLLGALPLSLVAFIAI